MYTLLLFVCIYGHLVWQSKQDDTSETHKNEEFSEINQQACNKKVISDLFFLITRFNAVSRLVAVKTESALEPSSSSTASSASSATSLSSLPSVNSERSGFMMSSFTLPNWFTGKDDEEKEEKKNLSVLKLTLKLTRCRLYSVGFLYLNSKTLHKNTGVNSFSLYVFIYPHVFYIARIAIKEIDC